MVAHCCSYALLKPRTVKGQSTSRFFYDTGALPSLQKITMQAEIEEIHSLVKEHSRLNRVFIPTEDQT